MSNRKFHFGNAGAAGRKESSANASRNASGSSSGAPGSAPNRFASFNSRSSKPPAPTLNAFTFRRAGPAPFATPSVPRGRPLSDQETFGAHRPTTPGPRLSTTPPFRGSCTADGSSNANHGRGSKELADGMLSLSGKDTQDFGGDYIRPNERHVNSRSNSRSDDEVENEDEHVRSSYDSFMYSEQDSDGAFLFLTVPSGYSHFGSNLLCTSFLSRRTFQHGRCPGFNFRCIF